jgi:hypothetical protein
MLTINRRDAIATAAAAAAAHTLHVLPVQAAPPAPATLNVGMVESLAVALTSLTGLVRTTHAEASALDPELDALLARAVADLDAGIVRLQEAAALAQG